MKETKFYLNGDGDFRSEECRAFLQECDMVVTNPPFSLSREFFKLVLSYNKQIIVIANGNLVTYKEIFPYIKGNKLWLGVSKKIGGQMYFNNNNGKFSKINSVCWFTNVEHGIEKQPLELTKKYNQIDYPKYDNFDAIESKTRNIPMDYYGVIGVPISFLDKYCPTQFEIVGDNNNTGGECSCKKWQTAINGKQTYCRIFIKRKDNGKE